MQAIQMGFESVVSKGWFPGELFKKFSPAALKDLNVVGSFVLVPCWPRVVFREGRVAGNLYRDRGRSEAFDQLE